MQDLNKSPGIRMTLRMRMILRMIMRMMLIHKDNDNGYADMNVRIKAIKTNMKLISNIHRSVSIYIDF